MNADIYLLAVSAPIILFAIIASVDTYKHNQKRKAVAATAIPNSVRPAQHAASPFPPEPAIGEFHILRDYPVEAGDEIHAVIQTGLRMRVGEGPHDPALIRVPVQEERIDLSDFRKK